MIVIAQEINIMLSLLSFLFYLSAVSTTTALLSPLLSLSRNADTVVTSAQTTKQQLLTSRHPGVVPRHRCQKVPATLVFLSNSNEDDDNENENEKKLVLGDSEIQAEMNTLRSKYPTSESAYLAAARARNVAKTASVETSAATDEDWQAMASEKRKAMGGDVVDDWENSKMEAGNMDSQILIPVSDSSGEDGDANTDDEEPKLLLF